MARPRFRLGEGEEMAAPLAVTLAHAGGQGEGSPVVLRAAPASAALFNCCTPLLLRAFRAGRRGHRYAIGGKMLLRLSQDCQSILLYRRHRSSWLCRRHHS